MSQNKTRDLAIRNSTVEFLIFTGQADGEKIEVRYENETIWLTQKLIAELFSVDRSVITRHLKNIFETGELDEKVSCAFFAQLTQHGAIQGKSRTQHVRYYNLDAIIAVGYRVNSVRATQFRQWATRVLHDFAMKGYVMDRKRLENGAFIGEDYFEHLLAEIREIRLSERRFYQKITDIYATSIDYSKDAPATRDFFAKVQNKLHYAVHGYTAAELIKHRADSKKPYMGLKTWEKAPDGKIVKPDVSVAKNYLTPDEMDSLGRIVNAYLDLAENRAKRGIPMTMEDWATRLDEFLKFDDRKILQNAGAITAKIAKDHAESEFEKFRVIQDREFISDFDKETQAIVEQITEAKDGDT